MTTLGQRVDAVIDKARAEIILLDALAAWTENVAPDAPEQWRSIEVGFSGIDSTWEVTLYAWNHDTVEVHSKKRGVALLQALEATKKLV